MKFTTASEVDLGHEKVGKLLFMLAVPAILSQIVNLLYNVVDRMYIGHIQDVGAIALTGVGVCLPIIMIVWEVPQELVYIWVNKIIRQLKKSWEIVLSH